MTLRRQRRRTKALEKATGTIIPWVFWRKKGPGIREDGQRVKQFHKAWKTALTKAGVSTNRRFHDFRHTVARRYQRFGVPENIAMKLTGHLTPSVFRNYAGGDMEQLREWAERAEEARLKSQLKSGRKRGRGSG